jgi:hypothetical protein
MFDSTFDELDYMERSLSDDYCLENYGAYFLDIPVSLQEKVVEHIRELIEDYNDYLAEEDSGETSAI